MTADGHVKDEITEKQTDKPRWIDTPTMICDPLTKSGSANFPERLKKTMSTGILDLVPTAASQMKKMQQQKARLDRLHPNDLSNLTETESWNNQYCWGLGSHTIFLFEAQQSRESRVSNIPV